MGYANFSKDITRRKENEEKLKGVIRNLEETQLASLNIMEDRDRHRHELNTSLKEKEVLLREIHHRVKNNMQIVNSLLRLQSRYVKDKEYREIFRECENRIKSMALVHEKLYQTKNLANIDFHDYTKKLTHDIFRAFGSRRGGVALRLEVDDIFLDIDTAIPCGLIVNELVTNALKHAFPGGTKGEIGVSIKKLKTGNLQPESGHRLAVGSWQLAVGS